jgi:ATP-dependent DNA ligase
MPFCMPSTCLSLTAGTYGTGRGVTRRARLERLLLGTERGIQLSEQVDAVDGATLFHHARKLGLAGIVAKRRDRPYRSGRSPAWIKVKNPEAPAAIRIIE